jgi:hypothetical protein
MNFSFFFRHNAKIRQKKKMLNGRRRTFTSAVSLHTRDEKKFKLNLKIIKN